jgi:hypothetical protein
MSMDSSAAKHGSMRTTHFSGCASVLLLVLATAATLGQNPRMSRAAQHEDSSSPKAGEQSYYTGAYSVVDLSPVEIMADFPELQGLEPASNQERLPTLLDKVGVSAASAYHRITSVVANESVTQEQYGYDGTLNSTLHSHFNYLIQVHGSEINDRLEEYRADSRMHQVNSPGPAEGFPYTKDFASQWILLYPENQSGCRFRYLGIQLVDGRKTYVLAFAERPGRAPVTGTISYRGKSAMLLYQGLVWIDALTYRVIKLRLDLLEPRLDIALEKETTQIKLGEVRISKTVDLLWLPLEVTVTVVSNGQIFRNRHQYSKYRLFVVQSTIRF